MTHVRHSGILNPAFLSRRFAGAGIGCVVYARYGQVFAQ